MMKKFLTYRTANILGYIGMALLAGSWFMPSHAWAEWLAGSLGIILTVIFLCANHYQIGYDKGFSHGLIRGSQQEAKRRAEQKPDAETFRAPSIFPREAANVPQPGTRAERKHLSRLDRKNGLR